MSSDEVKQHIFDTVVEHLVKQKKRSMRTRGSIPNWTSSFDFGYATDELCAYRGANGEKCAVGALIKDEFYTPSMEMNTITHPGVAKGVEASGFNLSDYSTRAMLHQLQRVHDDSNIYEVYCNGSPEAFRKALSEIANRNYLNKTVLDTLVPKEANEANV